MGQVDGNRMVVWHADFLRIIFANLCVCTSLYMFLPVVPACMGPVQLGGAAAAWLPFVAFAAGACLPAPFCNFWLDAYRRKSVALWALACLVAATALFLLDLPYYGKWLVRMAQGASYGVFQIAVGSTLLLDLSDTRKRTEAAHVYYWFARLALVFGPLAGVMLPLYHGAEAFSAVAVGLQVCAFLLLSGLRVPFRAPLEPSLFTFDRFWLPRGFRLFVPLFGVCLVAGLLMGRHCGAGFCVFLGVGFWLALWLHRCVFRERLQRELACGFCSLVVAALLRCSTVTDGMVLLCRREVALGRGRVPGLRFGLDDEPLPALLHPHLRALRAGHGPVVLHAGLGHGAAGRFLVLRRAVGRRDAGLLHLYYIRLVRGNGAVSFPLREAMVYAKQTKIV